MNAIFRAEVLVGGGYAPRGFVHIGAPDDIPSAVVFALTTPSHRLFAGV